MQIYITYVYNTSICEYIYMKTSVSVSCSFVSDSLRPHGQSSSSAHVILQARILEYLYVCTQIYRPSLVAHMVKEMQCGRHGF